MDSLRKKQIQPARTPTPEPEAIYAAEENQSPKKKVRWKKTLLYIFLIAGLFLFVWFGYFFWKIHSVGRNINVEEKTTSLVGDMQSTALSLTSSQRAPLEGEESGRINILLLGSAGEKNPGRNLTDTIMLASVNTQSKKISLLSLPRDLYVEIPGSASYAKINSLYQIGLKNNSGILPIKKAVENITGQKIHYYLVVDFEGFVKFVDALDGVMVNVERDIYDTRYPGPNYSYETFQLSKGFQELDGTTALKYVRERHDDPLGDFGRAKRQQQVIQAVKNKAFSLKTFLNIATFNSLLTTLEENVRTNLTLEEIESFIALSKQLDTQNITTKVVDAWNKDSLLKVSHIFFGEIRAFMLVPRVGNYSEIQDLSENIFELEKIEKRKIEMEQENASIAIINNSGDFTLTQKIKNLLSEKLGIQNVSIETAADEKTQSVTEIFDNSKGKIIFTLDELIKKIPAKPSSVNLLDSEKEYDLIITLGKDLINVYNFEEDSLEDFKNSQNDNQDYFETNI
ncbi:MAG: putative transcription regulator [uncultured bacterium]|nr:MAG: putative transcription regulator [uncultured bacterium]HBR72015.1 hypothetical protein [Candidatus Moranbacteria bacterium]